MVEFQDEARFLDTDMLLTNWKQRQLLANSVGLVPEAIRTQGACRPQGQHQPRPPLARRRLVGQDRYLSLRTSR